VVVDDAGRLLFHNSRLRELLGYEKDEIDLIDTRTFWHDLDQRSRIIDLLRQQGGQLLNEKVVWRTKKGQLLHLLISYVQVAYKGGHVSFVGGKRLCWVYDVTALTQREAQVVEQERQLREILEYCPAGLIVVDDEGRCCSTIGDCASLSAIAARSWSCSIPSGSGMTSTIAVGSSSS
jgi:PAS domain S-box-containing protein